ncbi:MAG: peptidase M16, partial [Acidobacteria bacterium]
VDRAITREIATLTEKGPTEAELERCLAQAEAHFIFRLQTVGGFGGKSDQLNAYNTFLGEPGFFERDLQRYRGASTEALRREGAQYLVANRRVVLSVVPRGRLGLALDASQRVAVS